MRFFIHLAYNGAPFHGWQRQPNAVSVQQTLEEALATVLRAEVPVVGAGRTDTGVNARCMYAHFDLPDGVDPSRTEGEGKRRLLTGLNRLCGRNIAIHDIIPVADDAHARFDATERTYRYFVSKAKTPFLHPLSWQATSPLDVEAMNEAAASLLDMEEFTSFAKLHSDARTDICDVRLARWEECVSVVTGEPLLVFTISADRFLRNMVRAIVGTLVEVGRGKLTPAGFRAIADGRDRCLAGTSMPPQALTLWNVSYPYIPQSIVKSWIPSHA